jgi:hypothetical protein
MVFTHEVLFAFHVFDVKILYSDQIREMEMKVKESLNNVCVCVCVRRANAVLECKCTCMEWR